MLHDLISAGKAGEKRQHADTARKRTFQQTDFPAVGRTGTLERRQLFSVFILQIGADD